MSFDYGWTVKRPPRPTPRPQIRVIVPKGGGKPFGQAYLPESKGGYGDWVRANVVMAETYGPDKPIEGPVLVELVFSFERPSSHVGKKGQPLKAWLPYPKPDVDNLAKGVLDAMTKAKVFNDDEQVCELVVRKRFVDPGQPGSVDVRVHPVSQDELAQSPTPLLEITPDHPPRFDHEEMFAAMTAFLNAAQQAARADPNLDASVIMLEDSMARLPERW